MTAENEDVSQVAGATGVGAGLSGHHSTALLAATPYCIYDERLREYLTLERSRGQDRDTRLCELSWFQSLTSSNWIKLHVHQRFKWAPTVREIIQALGLDFSWSLSFVFVSMWTEKYNGTGVSTVIVF